ncbi:hypothetical protein DAPPUDRAFT_307503 [Daphnia pulex]|uniref:NTF2 domain-containing protein n=1 Tax=Daphnia pulex TaxID=6669 RepID=E9H2I1_DAPPU|nr:hypothetical protein DAPPUDRAFT_307503 [Daphnia pulex]|eukprot:EFX74063.1 hypothetical protein DAPPUDRAFT_307503 [Daphnia pulex]
MLPGEISGIRDLLSRLENDVVYALADTATKRALAFTSVNDAIDAIILHSESAFWFLNRKKLTRAILFEYLNARRIPISGQAEKAALITRTLELWNSEPQQIAAVVSPTTVSISHQEPRPSTPEMGLQFTKWFYELLFAVHKQSAIGTKLSEQFWRDARLKITLNSSAATDCQEMIGSDEAANLLQMLLCQHGFLLNPNLSSNGVRERKDPHGMVIIGVCGTAHQYDNCSGIFEQVFGLVQDPHQDFNWKIKWSELRITQATVNRLPCLNDLPELQALL